MKFGCYDIQSGGVRRQEKFALSLVGMKLVKTRCCFSPIFYRAQMQHWHLNDAAALHHDDFVGLLDCRKPVRYHDCSPPPPTASPVSDELIQRLLHHLFAVRVQGLPKPTPPVRLSAAETLVSKCKPEPILGDSRQCGGASRKVGRVLRALGVGEAHGPRWPRPRAAGAGPAGWPARWQRAASAPPTAGCPASRNA